jgi:lysozyme
LAKKKKKKNRLVAWIFLFLMVLAMLWAGRWWMSNRFPVRGIDVSHHQGKIDWPRVKADGITFAFIKSTEGLSNVDPDFDQNWEQAKDAKIARGAYHFFHANLDGTAQAQHFLRHTLRQAGDLPPVLDLEITDNMSAATIRKEAWAWCKTVEEAWGVKPIVYTLPHYANSFLEGKFGRFPLWVVDLGFLDLWPGHCQGWSSWTFWQKSHHGAVDGITGEVDLDVFNGSPTEFNRLRR